MINQLNIEHAGFLLSVKIVGQGKDVVVIGSSDYYSKTFSSDLYQKHRFIFVDHRGFAKCHKKLQVHDLQLDRIVEDLEFVIKKLRLEQFFLLGHSGHAYMCLAYAQKNPNHISKLILMNFSPYGGAKNFEAANIYFQESVCPDRKVLFSQNMAKLPQQIAENPERAFVTRMLAFGPMLWFDPNYDAANLWQDVKLVPEVLDNIWGNVFNNIDIAKYAQGLNIPVLLLLGRYDYFNPPYLWEDYRKYFNSLTIRVFEKSGHTPQLEEPNNFEHELLEFLNK